MTRSRTPASDASDWVNPVAVKEFRQAVQSRWVVAVLMLFLLLNLTVVGGYLLLSPDIDSDSEGGQEVFFFLLSILVFVCLGFVPAYTGIRLSLERHSTDIDLFFTTALTPGAIVRGKYLAAMALTLLIFSTCMPFMVLTYLLRGIDLPTVFFILVNCFALCAVANALGLFAGAVAGGWLIRGLVAAGAVLLMIWTFFAILEIVADVLRYGFDELIDYGIASWAAVGTLLLIEASAVGLLYVFAVAFLSPGTSNRMMAPRLYATGCWAVTGAVALLWSIANARMEPLATWAEMATVVLSVLIVAAVGERDAWSVRVRRTIPRNPLRRLGAFLVYTGSAGGLLWYTILFTITMVGAYTWGEMMTGFGGWGAMVDLIPGSFIWFGFILCYCLTVAALRPVLFRDVPTSRLSVFVMSFGVAMCLVPCLMAFFIEQYWWLADPWYFVLSPLALTARSDVIRSLADSIVVAWLGLAALAAAPWALGQWHRFTPHCPPQPQESRSEWAK
jgi:hypothetical protein